MKNTLLLFSYVTIIALFTSCSPKFYSPNTHNVPLISQKGDVHITVSGNADQVELQGAAGVSDAFSVILNGGLFIPKNEDNGNGGSGKFIEAGPGFFLPVASDFVFETYGLIGIGSFENHMPGSTGETNTKGDISARLTRLGVQPNFGYKSEYFTIGISSRFVHVGYSDIKGDLIFEERDQIQYLKDHGSNFMIEPALTLRGGIDKAKFQFQIGKSFNISNPDFRQDDILMTVGLFFKL